MPSFAISSVTLAEKLSGLPVSRSIQIQTAHIRHHESCYGHEPETFSKLRKIDFLARFVRFAGSRLGSQPFAAELLDKGPEVAL